MRDVTLWCPRADGRSLMSMSDDARAYAFGVRTPCEYAEAVARTLDALTNEGFGVITRIDVRQTMHDKLGVDFRPYVILGACNPRLAHRALNADLRIGLLLPCNV